MGKAEKINPDLWLDRYGDYLYRYALFRLNDSSLAEDLVQETFLAALKAHDRFEGASSLRTWFVSILKHKIIDHYRKAQRQKTHEERDVGGEFQEDGKWIMERAPSEWGDNPEASFDQKEFYLVLQQCLATLPDRIAHVFSLREIDGMDSKNICKTLDISSSNLWVILHRARSLLRRCLDVNWFGRNK